MVGGATTAAATCWGRSNYCCGGDGSGNLSGGSTLFLSQCQRRWMKAVGGGGGGNGGQWLAAETVLTAVDGNSREPPTPLSLAAVRQSLADNGR
jgi:hypothetical protein